MDLYPFTGHTLDLDGLDLHYLDEGQGEPVVMVHGNPSWSFYYRNLVLNLRDRYRCIVPDHIGCGHSDKPDDSRYEYRLHRRIDDLERLLEHLGVREKITLVVHDWGGMIGMGYANRHPERIARLVVLNTAAFHLPTTKALPWSLWLTRNTSLGAFLVRGLNAFARGAATYGCTRSTMPAEVRAGYLAPYNSWKNRIAVLRFVQDIPLKPGDQGYDLVTDIANGLPRFAGLPLLLCWGEKDFVFDRHFLDEWLQRFPNAEVHRYPDAGHYVLEDVPEIVPLIRRFLDAHPHP